MWAALCVAAAQGVAEMLLVEVLDCSGSSSFSPGVAPAIAAMRPFSATWLRQLFREPERDDHRNPEKQYVKAGNNIFRPSVFDPKRPLGEVPLSLKTEHRIDDFSHGSLSDQPHMPWVELRSCLQATCVPLRDEQP